MSDEQLKYKTPCEIQEYYSAYPAINARKIIESLLRSVPPKDFEGLGAIILCDSHSYKEQYNTDKQPLRGSYCRLKDSQDPSWIEICVDRIANGWGKFPLKIPFVRDLIFGEVLYHEIGHHVHCTQTNENEDSEAFAKKYAKQLMKRHYFKRHWYATILLLVLTLPFKKMIKSRYESYKNNLSKSTTQK